MLLSVGCPFCAGVRASKTNNLLNNYPEIAREWDVGKNGSLSPKDMIATSRKLVWWKCSHGHSWNDSVRHRTVNHRGCPVCGVPHFISLSSRFPSIVPYWDYSRNLTSSPDSVSIGCQKSAYWICSSCSKSFSLVISRMLSQYLMCRDSSRR